MNSDMIMNYIMKPKLVLTFSALLSALCLSGFASSGVKNPSGVPVTEMNASERGFVAGTGIESQDLVTVADKMARGLLNLPAIANAKAPPYVPRCISS